MEKFFISTRIKRRLSHYLKVAITVFCIVISNNVYAQYFPYNPYNNPYAAGYQLGQQIGNAIAQNQKYGRGKLLKAIDKWGECKNGSLSLEHGAVAIYGDCGYHCTSTVDDRISSKLSSINNNRQSIDDINILENGQFVIVYNNGNEWYGVLPNALKSALDEYPYHTIFRSISFNENGTYAITTTTGFRSNDLIYQQFYDDNVDEYGDLLSVNINGNGAVFCYSDGVRFCGNVPNVVVTAAKQFSRTAQFVKFNKHGDYLICNKYGAYRYCIGDANSGGNATTTYYNYAQERMKKAKERAYSKWDNDANYLYLEDSGIHRVWCELTVSDYKIIELTTSISSSYNTAPSLGIQIADLLNLELNEMVDNIPSDGLKGMLLKIELSNGEIITSNDTAIYKTMLGCRLSTSLVDMRSDRKILSGTTSCIKYLIGQFSNNNIKSITIKGRYTFDFKDVDSKSQLCYDFYRLAYESGRTDILP